MFYIKVHDSGNKNVIALCDRDLIGKIFKENGIKLEINEKFYKGELKNKEELREILINGENFNIVGKEAVKFCVECEVISEENIRKVEKVPFAIAFTL